MAKWDDMLRNLEERRGRVVAQEERARAARAQLVEDARSMVAHGCPVVEVARALGVSRQRAYVLMGGGDGG